MRINQARINGALLDFFISLFLVSKEELAIFVEKER